MKILKVCFIVVLVPFFLTLSWGNEGTIASQLYSSLLLSQKYLKDYDSELLASQNNKNIFHSQNYQILLKLKEKIDELSDQLIHGPYNYAQILKGQWDGGQQVPQEILRLWQNALWSEDKKEQLADISLKNEIEKNISDPAPYPYSVIEKELVKKKIKVLKSEGLIDPIYPSETEAGNVTGFEYPDKTWSLTFDDGPDITNTPKVLQTLISHDLKATFFIVGNSLNIWPQISEQVKKENMEMASHSYTHMALSQATAEQLQKEVKGAKDLIEKKLSVDVHLMRLPYGDAVYNILVRRELAKNHLIHVYWNIDSIDWNDPNPDSVFLRVKNTIEAMIRSGKKDAGIILFHDRKAVTAKASGMVMDYLKSRQVSICPIGRVIEQINTHSSSCQ